jgi:hypothetical protein
MKKGDDDDDEGYPFPLVVRPLSSLFFPSLSNPSLNLQLKKGRGGSISGTTSGLTTPGGVSNGGQGGQGANGRSKTLSENDLAQADAALSHRSSLFLLFLLEERNTDISDERADSSHPASNGTH